MSISDREANKILNYFLMGYYFHFTPEDVDKMDATLVEGFLIALGEWKKKENEVNS